MSDMTRREALAALAAAPLAAFTWTAAEAEQASLRVAAARKAAAATGAAYQPQFFTAHEWETVRVLVDLIIPADEKSGSATDAGVPEFMDFILNESSELRQRSMREGLAWLDAESRRRNSVAFVDASDAQRRAILDDIAWPARAPESMRDAVSWFNGFRDLTAAGFFSSRIGYDDLDFRGNEFVTEWQGCPPAALEKLGVSYDLMEDNG